MCPAKTSQAGNISFLLNFTRRQPKHDVKSRASCGFNWLASPALSRHGKTPLKAFLYDLAVREHERGVKIADVFEDKFQVCELPRISQIGDALAGQTGGGRSFCPAIHD